MISSIIGFSALVSTFALVPSVESFRYVSIREVEAQDSIRRSLSSSSLSTEINDYHVVEVKIKLTPESGYSQPSTYLGQTVTHEELRLAIKAPAFVPYGLADPAAGPWPPGTSDHCISGDVTNSAEITFYAPMHATQATGASASTSVSWKLYMRRYNGSTVIGDDSYEVTANIYKYECDDASIDSRRSYGQPNTEGILPGADANAPYRAINFGDYRFKGGLFVGKTSGSPDRSRTARLQLWPQGVTSLTDVKAACVSVFALNQPTGFTGTQSYGAYVPKTDSANLTQTELTATWEKGWTIDPAVSGSSGDDRTQTHHFALDVLSIPTGDQNHIWSWNLTYPSSVTDLVPPKVGSAVCIALADESSSYAYTWRYFASKEYIAALPSSSPYNAFPANDARARLFLLK